jgi:GT2 family glycosyltransferase
MKFPESESARSICPAKLITIQGCDPHYLDHSSGASSENVANAFRSCAIIVGIPVQNEARYISNCLAALARQPAACRHGVVLLLNNCSDDTSMVVRDLVPRLPMPVLAINTTLPPGMANAGCARRLTMQYAASVASPGSILMTTDADGQVSPDWLATNLAAFQSGADAVAGRAELDSADAQQLPTRLQEDDARECRYDQLLDEIHAKLDPDPADPWPRHTEHSGASIAVTLEAYRKVGGFPAVPVGEDRAFIEALRRVDARIRHSPDVRVVVSGRIIGRAVGGMADTIRRRLTKSDEMLDERLEPARSAAQRAWMRGLLREIWTAGRSMPTAVSLLSGLSKVPEVEIKMLLLSRHFGEAWAELEKRSPALYKSRVRTRDLSREVRVAQIILESLKRHQPETMPNLEGPVDNPDFGAA